MTWYQWILIVLDLAVLPYMVFLLVVGLAAVFARKRPVPRQEPRSRLLVVIPAHNEESGIARTVGSCRAADYPESLFEVAVIADNCSDRTAEVAAEAGARVVDRFDSVKKSKGYAIEYLIQQVEQSGEMDSLDALVLVDADTTIDPHLLRCFDADLRAGRDWIQSYYTVANADQNWRTRLITYSFSLFNGVLLQGQCKLGTSASLRGNGMCFSVPGLRRRPWGSHGLVEDMEYTWSLRIAGEKIAFEPGATVYGEMLTTGGKAAASQRQRWEFGRQEVRSKYLLLLLRSRQIGRREKLLGFFELSLPTMGTLLTTYAILMVWNFLASWSSRADGGLPKGGLFLACNFFMTVALGVYVLSPFVAMRLPWRFFWALASFPIYMAWKVLVSLRGRPKEWVRTPRESRTRADVAT
jgi:cellulose synthase/poly-beta-1,6-N-acetylglucosamine synthase-like glycosyltransferase